MKEIIINENDASQRLDKFITKFMPNLPKGMLYKGLRKNCVKINGKHIKTGDYMLKSGDIIRLYFKDEFFENAAPSVNPDFTDEDLDIVYEDENLLLINKRAGIVAHADDRGSEKTLIDLIKGYLYKNGEYNPELEHSFSPALCNRLDRNTGGIIIAAKNAAALREMNEKIRNREVKKFYLCIVEGILQGSGSIEGYLTRLEKRAEIRSYQTPNSKYVKTNYSVISNDNNTTLAEAELLTGRTHQIRASFAHIGHPLLGDKKYGSKHSGGYSLCSYKIIFEPNGGMLDYLSTKTFAVNVGFAENFSSQNL